MKALWGTSLLCFTCLLTAHPENHTVVSGGAEMSRPDINTLEITTQNKTILNWNSFSIAEGETTRFIQPEASSAVLNRVVGKTPTEIFGSLLSNGRVYLINPEGIVIGEKGIIDTAEFLASTLNLSNEDFLQGSLHFQGSSAVAIVNLGTIISRTGDTCLIGARITQNGKISAPQGRALLGSGSDILLQPSEEHPLLIQPAFDKAYDIENAGDIEALKIDIAAAGTPQSLAIRNSGNLDALHVESRDGKIYLRAHQGEIYSSGKMSAPQIEISAETLHLTSSSRLAAPSGKISLQIDELLKNEGSMSAGAVDIGGNNNYLVHNGSIDAQNTISIAVNTFLNGGSLTIPDGGRININVAGYTSETTAARVIASRGLITHQAYSYFSSGQYHAQEGTIAVYADRMNLIDAQYHAADTTIGISPFGDKASHLHIGPTTQVRGQARLSIAPTITAPVLQAGCSSCLPTSVFEFVDPTDPAIGSFGIDLQSLPNGNVVITKPDATINGNAVAGAVFLYNGTTGALISQLTGSQANDTVGANQNAAPEYNVGIVVLTNGNVVIMSPSWSGGGLVGRGAATWLSSSTPFVGVVDGASNSIVGTNPGDSVTFWDTFTYLPGVFALSTGNYAISSPFWNGGQGAATWASGAGPSFGPITPLNSLVGSLAGDKVSLPAGSFAAYMPGIIPLPNGNYLVTSPNWTNMTGAVTLASGTSASPTGTIDGGNSLIGSGIGDRVGSGPDFGPSAVSTYAFFQNIAVLSSPNDNKYVVLSPHWNSQAGAATWGDGTTLPGTVNTINAGNSLIGSNPNDQVGGFVQALTNGNYVVCSPNWNAGGGTGAGAATWGNGSTGTTGTISAANSLIGASVTDHVGSGTALALTNGHYVVCSPFWSSDTGAATLSDGTLGTPHGIITAANSLIGASPGDVVSSGFAMALTNGNYVVMSPSWSGTMGAATFCLGTPATPSPVGPVTMANSLVGSAPGDRVGRGSSSLHSVGGVALTNGNYVVGSTSWNNSRGAATWGNGITGIQGPVSGSNSLIGTTPASMVIGDQVGAYLYALSNGNYVMESPNWHNGATFDAGIVTLGIGTGGTVGPANAANSFVGTYLAATIGFYTNNPFLFFPAILELGDGCFAAFSAPWNGGLGAVTFGSTTTPPAGAVSAANSFVGSVANDSLWYGFSYRLLPPNLINTTANTLLMNFPFYGQGHVYNAQFCSTPPVPPTPPSPSPSAAVHVPSRGLGDFRQALSEEFQQWGPYYYGGSLAQDTFAPDLTYKNVENKEMPSLLHEPAPPQQKALVEKRKKR